METEQHEHPKEHMLEDGAEGSLVKPSQSIEEFMYDAAEDKQPTKFVHNPLKLTGRRKLLAKVSWYMYDWANSTYYTQVVSLFLPLYFQQVAAEQYNKDSTATNIFAGITSIAMALVAIIAPLLGTIADEFGLRKLLMIIAICIGALSCSLLIVVDRYMWILCGILFILSRVGFGIADTFYNSLLIFITDDEKELNDASSKGYILGYISAGLLLGITVVIYLFAWNSNWTIRISFVVCGVWWFIFSIPMMIWVPEPPNAQKLLVYSMQLSSEAKQQALEKLELRNADNRTFKKRLMLFFSSFKVSILRLVATAKAISHFKNLLVFLIAFWFYNDGISTVINMTIAFVGEIRDPATGEFIIGNDILYIAMVIFEILCAPFCALFIPLANKIGSKISILITLVIYFIVTISSYWLGSFSLFNWGLRITTIVHFSFITFMIALVLGSSQALSRSLFATLCPPSKSGEFYGFFGFSSRFAGIFGPLVFSVVGAIFKNSRAGMASVAVFFVVGFFVLIFVKEKDGSTKAKEFEQQQQLEVLASLNIEMQEATPIPKQDDKKEELQFTDVDL